MTTGANFSGPWIALKKSARRIFGEWRIRLLLPITGRWGLLSSPDLREWVRRRREVASEARERFRIGVSSKPLRTKRDRICCGPVFRWEHPTVGAGTATCRASLETDSDSEVAGVSSTATETL